MGHSASGTAASAAAPARQPPGTVRLAGMLTLSCLTGHTGQTTVTLAGELARMSGHAGQAGNRGPGRQNPLPGTTATTDGKSLQVSRYPSPGKSRSRGGAAARYAGPRVRGDL